MKIREIAGDAARGFFLAASVVLPVTALVVLTVYLVQGVEHQAAVAIGTLCISLGVTAWEVYQLRTRVNALEQRVRELEERR